MQSTFKTDSKIADDIVHFVYETIFLGEEGLGYTADEAKLVDFSEEPEKQFAGADIIMFPNSTKECNVEVKAAINSAGERVDEQGRSNSLMTFAQEISYLNEAGSVCDGWLIDETKQSDVYVFCWFPEVKNQSKQGYTRLKTIADIKKMDVAMVKVVDIQNELIQELKKQENIDDFNDVRRYLVDKSSDMRKHNRKTDKFGSYTMLLSSQMEEQPINLLIPKTTLIKKAFHSYAIHRKDTSLSESIEWVTIPFK